MTLVVDMRSIATLQIGVWGTATARAFCLDTEVRMLFNLYWHSSGCPPRKTYDAIILQY
jgi:hypothetical protein